MVLANPNTDSAEFEQLNNYFRKADKTVFRIVEAENAKYIADIFLSKNIYQSSAQVFNVIEYKKGDNRFYLIHIIIDRSYDISPKYGQRDLGFEDHLWGIKLDVSDFGVIRIVPKTSTQSSIEIAINNLFRIFFRRREEDFLGSKNFDFTYSDKKLFNEFIKLPIIIRALSRKNSLYIMQNADCLVVGNYSSDVINTINSCISFFN